MKNEIEQLFIYNLSRDCNIEDLSVQAQQPLCSNHPLDS